MELLVLIVALIVLAVSLTTLCLVILILKAETGMTLPDFTNPFTKSTTNNTTEKDSYKPDYAEESTAIEDFEPDFSRPLTVKVENGKQSIKEFTTDGQELTPITTDDLQEEDEDTR